MRILDTVPDDIRDYHILTFAEVGFAMLSIYGEPFGLDRETLQRFADSVNERNEVGTLWPVAPISAIPRAAIRAEAPLADEVVPFIREFWQANDTRFKAKKLVLSFLGGSLLPHAKEAALRVLTEVQAEMQADPASHFSVEEVVIQER